MNAETRKLIDELNRPHTDFPSYFTDLAKRAANALDSKEKSGFSEVRRAIYAHEESPDTFTVDTSARILHKHCTAS